MSSKVDTSNFLNPDGSPTRGTQRNDRGGGMSFEEKSVWVQLVATLIAFVIYVGAAGSMLAAGQRAMPAFAGLFIAATIFLIILLVAGCVIAALSGGHEPSDERDRLIAWRAEHNSSWLLATGVFGAVVCLLLGLDNALTVNLLIVALFAAEILGFALRAAYYRKGV